MSNQKKMMDCPKCGGTGYIPAFSGIANGDCFRCVGSGKVAYRVSAVKVKPMSEYQAKIVETIKTADMSKMSYAQLASLRNAAHYPCPQCPDLLKIWRERGDAFFFSAQEERLQSI